MMGAFNSDLGFFGFAGIGMGMNNFFAYPA